MGLHRLGSKPIVNSSEQILDGSDGCTKKLGDESMKFGYYGIFERGWAQLWSAHTMHGHLWPIPIVTPILFIYLFIIISSYFDIQV